MNEARGSGGDGDDGWVCGCSTEKTCAPARQAGNGGDEGGEGSGWIGDDGWVAALPRKLALQPDKRAVGATNKVRTQAT